MSEDKKKKLRGFASIVSKQIEPLQENQKFKEKFKDTETKILINAKDGKYAALLVIDKGTIHVEGYKNNPKKNIKKKVLGWNGLIQAKTSLFLELLGGEDVSLGKIIGKVLTGRLKIRGLKSVLLVLQLFEL
ncbi:MAG: hypothetical protein ACFFCI_03595 [Promethearchaeota archaeon]